MILENPPPLAVQLVGKMPKAHSKGIINLQFVCNGVHVALCSVGHDSIKMWDLNDMEPENMVVLTEDGEFGGWRCGVQAAHTLPNATCTGVIGADSVIYTLQADDVGSHIRAYDMGYMEVWHLAVADAARFITTSFSGFLSEVVDGKFGVREPFPKIKSVTCMSLSPSGSTLAIGSTEGAVDIVDGKTLKVIHNFEAHSMRISSVLLLSDDQLLTGGTDKYIKYFKVEGKKLERVLCGHRGAVSCMVAAPTREGLPPTTFASASINGQVILWNLDAPEPLAYIDVLHEGAILALAFSPCGQFLVSGGDDKLICLYRVADEPVDENAPLLNSGKELRDEMREVGIEDDKENEQPRKEERREKRREDEGEEMDMEEESEQNGRQGSARDLFGDSSDSEGEGRREEEGERGYGEEEEEVRVDGYDDEGGDVNVDGDTDMREEEGEGEEYSMSRGEEGEEEEEEEESVERKYIPSAIKKEEPMHEGYGDTPNERERTPTYEDDE